jgi:CHAD domain-containing protein
MQAPPDEGDRTGESPDQSRSYRLKPGEGAAAGLRRIAAGRAERALERLRDAEGERLADSIHGARKDLKKLRAVLRLVGAELGKKALRRESRRYRDAGRLLSGSRDAEVKLNTLVALRHRFGAAFPGEAASGWQDELERERAELAERTSGGGPVAAEAAAAIAAGGDRIADWSLEADSWALVGPGLRRTYRSGRRRLRRTAAEPSDENVHELRKRVKDLWYQLRILQDSWPAVLGATVEEAHGMAEALGDHHDLAILREDLQGRGIGEQRVFEQLIERRQRELLDQAMETGRRLYAEKPKPFGRRVEAYWLSRSTSPG